MPIFSFLQKFEHKSNYFLLLIIILYVVESLILLDKYILPNDDEVLFALTAKSFSEEGVIKCDFVIGQESGVYWQPPFYFILLGSFFKVFGFGFYQMRIFSVILSVLLLILIYNLSNKILKSSLLSLIVVLFVVLDPHFVRYSKIGRMDILTLLLIISAIIFYIGWLVDKKHYNLLGVGVFNCFAAATHPLGLIAPIGIFIHLLFLKKRVKEFINIVLFIYSPIILIVIVGYISIYNNYDNFIEQLSFQFQRKGERTLIESITNWISRYRYLPTVLIFIGISILSIINIIRKKLVTTELGLISIVLLFIVIIVSLNFELFYSMYLLPFVGVLIIFTIQNIHIKFKNIMIVLFISWFVNVMVINGYFNYFYLSKGKEDTDLRSLSEKISIFIPENSTIYTIGYPNLYWNLIKLKNYKIFSPVLLSENRIDKYTSTAEYFIFTSAFNYQEDKVYTEKLYDEFSKIFISRNYKLEFIKDFGSKNNYAARANLYKVVKEKKE